MAKPRIGKKDLVAGPPLEFPAGDSEEIQPEFLLLDPQNLRLLERFDSEISNVNTKLIGQPSIQRRVFEILWNDPLFDVASLEKSIIYNGFLKHERLIVARYDERQYIVLEGNRRLTAVRHILSQNPRGEGLRPDVRQSLISLPCFVLSGDPIGSSEKTLNEYRRAAEIYIGMRHLMGAKRWEPASRYEFQAKLLDEGWTVDEVAERFGRKRLEVVRDLKAQKLYRDFRTFEAGKEFKHSLTYNSFAEAARAPSIMKWLGWSDNKQAITKKENEQVFFHYLSSKLRTSSRVSSDGEEGSPDESAEEIVRRLREMLKLGDPLIEDALKDRDFDSAEILFEERKEGTFAKRIASYTRGLKRVTSDELGDNPTENRKRIEELIKQAQKTIKILEALSEP
jgi:hypothetical protein